MRFHFLGTLLVLTLAPRLAAQNWPGRSVRLVPSGVEILDAPNGTPRRIFFDSTAWGVNDPAVAPGGARVGVIRWEQGQLGGTGYVVPPIPTVVVIDAGSGRVLLRVLGGLAFEWCGNDCISVLYGHYDEGSEGGPYGDSLGIFEPSTGEQLHSYHPAGVSFIAPAWRPADSTIVSQAYDRDGYRVSRLPGIRIELRSGEFRIDSVVPGVPSASGQYVIQREEGDSGWVRRRSVPAIDIAIPIGGRWQIEEWLGRTDKVLLLQLPPLRPRLPGAPRPRVRPSAPRDPNALPAERTYRIWDVPTGQVSEEWKAAETPWRGPAPNGCRLFLKENKLTAAPGCR